MRSCVSIRFFYEFFPPFSFSFRKNMLKNIPKNEGSAPYEEISEKRTTIVGYILLFLMIIFIVVVGQTVFEDLSDVPAKPEKISACSVKLRDILSSETDRASYYDLRSYNFSEFESEDDRYPGCVFSKYESQSGMTLLFPKIEAKLLEYSRADRERERLDEEIDRAEEAYQQGAGDYGLSLEEKQSGVKPIIKPETATRDFVISSTKFSALQKERASEVETRDAALAVLRESLPDFPERYRKMLTLQKTDYSRYSIKLFLLSLLFVTPFFAGSLWWYFRSKRRNSPYSVIAGAIVVASAALFVQVAIRFLSDIIPHRLIELFFDFFRRFLFLRYVLYYGAVLLVVILFGGVVFFIQKRIFHPSVIAIRRLKDRKCPSCSFAIDAGMRFCPKCARELRASCEACGQLCFKDLPACEHCGHRVDLSVRH